MALHPYSLTVLRRGVELESFPLTSHPYYPVGRLPPPQSLLSLAHPSISRHHAVLQHRDDGRLFVFDRGSAHGTKLNKRRIPPHEFVELHVGDLLAFGDSERFYVVEGPDELRLPERELRRKGPAPPPQRPVEAKEETAAVDGKEERKGEEEEFATWGMREEVGEAEEEVVDPSDASSALYHRLSQYLLGATPSLSSADIGALNDSQRAILQRVERRKLKASNMAEEVETLHGKERRQGSLTDGQQAQMERNERRIEGLQAEILDELEALKDSLSSRTSAAPAGRRRRADAEDAGDDSDDDEFFDRSLAQNKAGAAQLAGTAAVGAPVAVSAVSPLAALLPLSSLQTTAVVTAQLRRCEELRDALRVVLRDLSVADDAASAADSLDAFMGRVEAQRRAEKRENVKGELRRLQSHFEQLTTRLKETEAEERVQRLRRGEADTAAAAANDSSHSEAEQKANGETASSTAPASAASTPPTRASANRPEATEPQAQATGGVAEALARMRRTLPPAASSAASAHSAVKSAPIGPALRPCDASTASPAFSAQSTAAPPSSSSSLSELARRLDAARASTGAQSRGDSSVSSALKRRMEATALGGTAGEGDGGGLAVAKRRLLERDRGEATLDLASGVQSAFDMEWKPPVNQTGDGRTAHNARLGY